MQKRAVIIGAGPAGLTTAYELLKRTGIKPLVYEMTGDIGGISKTVNFKGNRIDIGGHRFFSKSDRVMDWWRSFFAVQRSPSCDDIELGRIFEEVKGFGEPDPQKTDRVMLVRHRLSRILYLRKFFDYPISLNLATITNLGIVRLFRIGTSYVMASAFPIRNERTLEHFLINRFGRQLYRMFFADYTEKVWGRPCSGISNEWGAQRIKGLSITRALVHAVKKVFARGGDIAQKDVETSLIEKFLYPKYGPGQLWEEVAAKCVEMGGEIHLGHKAVGLVFNNGRAAAVRFTGADGAESVVHADYVISTMPIKELVASIEGVEVPGEVAEIAAGLEYRDFVTVGVLLSGLKVKNTTRMKTVNGLIPDNWIYIQEPDVKMGRIQVFNNWSPYMVADRANVWLGIEYFCNEGDRLWSMSEEEWKKFAAEELVKINFIEPGNVIDSVVIKLPKTYPAYFGTYDRMDRVRDFLDGVENLFLVGRNGMHRYNNQDHSMLTAMTAVDNMLAGVTAKQNIWEVNTEESYHEEK